MKDIVIWFLKLLRVVEHDVEDIVKEFDKTVRRLNRKADNLYLSHCEKLALASKLEAEAGEAFQASQRAGKIASNIKSLING